MKRNILLVVALLWIFTACDNKSKENKAENKEETPTVKTAANNDSKAGENTKTSETKVTSSTETAETKKVEDKGPKAKIKFEETEFDFGEISEGTLAKHTFNFTNTGDVPLVIKNARGSCGCTVPDWPRSPIAPGKTGEIKVQFNSQGRSGVQTKTVTLTTNTEEGTQMLQIKSKVLAKANGPVKK